jgi:hypothetical protein
MKPCVWGDGGFTATAKSNRYIPGDGGGVGVDKSGEKTVETEGERVETSMPGDDGVKVGETEGKVEVVGEWVEEGEGERSIPGDADGDSDGDADGGVVWADGGVVCVCGGRGGGRGIVMFLHSLPQPLQFTYGRT